MRTGWATALAAILVAVGCGAEAGPAADISGTWWAVELDGEPIEIDHNTAELPWFEITGTTIGGNLGCNSGGGSYQLQGNRLLVSNLESEGELCGIPDGSEIMVPTERFIREMLTTGSGADVTVTEGTMTWTGAGHVVTFTSASGAPPSPTTVPPQDFDRLHCTPGVVVESRHPAGDISPEELAADVEPTTVRVEQGEPLQWWGYDDQGNVTVGVFLGDVPNPDYQVVTCSE